MRSVYTNPRNISLTSSAKEKMLDVARQNEDEDLILCLFYYHIERNWDQHGAMVERGPGYQLGFYEKSKVPKDAIMEFRGVQLAFRLHDEDKDLEVSFSDGKGEFSVSRSNISGR